MRNSKGFTLIELVIVIVILGILAATAAPKFIDLTGDARTATMEGLEGSIQSAIEISHAKALVEGETAADSSIQIASEFYAMPNGWPAAISQDGQSASTGYGITELVEADFTESGDFIATPSLVSVEFSHRDATTPGDCTITYFPSSDVETRPTVVSNLTGC